MRTFANLKTVGCDDHHSESFPIPARCLVMVPPSPESSPAICICLNPRLLPASRGFFKSRSKIRKRQRQRGLLMGLFDEIAISAFAPLYWLGLRHLPTNLWPDSARLDIHFCLNSPQSGAAVW